MDIRNFFSKTSTVPASNESVQSSPVGAGTVDFDQNDNVDSQLCPNKVSALKRASHCNQEDQPPSKRLECTLTIMDLSPIDGQPKQPMIKYPGRNFGKQMRSFNSNWFKTFPWLEYSVQGDSAFCFPCRHFISQDHSVIEEAFVSAGFNNWKKALEKFKSHEQSKCHMKAAERWLEFRVRTSCGTDVFNLIQNEEIDQIKARRSFLHPIIEVLLLTGRQGMAQRGKLEGEDSANRGTFIEILQLVRKFQPINNAKDFSLPGNANYLSPSSQNELIDISAEMIRENIISEIKDSGYYSILADETRDISKTEQMSICFRYVFRGKLKERFLCFTNLSDLSAQGLKTILCKKVQDYGLGDGSAVCVGQGYDGVAVMSGHLNGVQQLFRSEHPKPIYVHCYCHRLNLVLVSVCLDIVDARNFFNVLQSIYSYFSTSGKAHQSFMAIQQELGIRCIELQGLSDTRWACQIRSIKAVKKTYPALLKYLSESKDGDTIKACGLHTFLKSFSTVLALFIFEKLLEISSILNNSLQSPNTDIAEALSGVQAVIGMLRDMRSDQCFDRICKEAEDFALTLGLTSTPPTEDSVYSEVRIQPRRIQRIPRTMTDYIVTESIGHRESTNDMPTTLKTNLYYAIIDRMVNELTRRFGDENAVILSGIYSLSPISVKTNKFFSLDEMKQFCDHYEIPFSEAEISVAKKFVENLETKPASLLELLQKIPKDMFPSLFAMLQIAITIPVTSASCERSFSVLRRIKSYLRNTMGHERCSSLGLLAIENESCKNLCTDCITDKFGGK